MGDISSSTGFEKKNELSNGVCSDSPNQEQKEWLISSQNSSSIESQEENELNNDVYSESPNQEQKEWPISSQNLYRLTIAFAVLAVLCSVITLIVAGTVLTRDMEDGEGEKPFYEVKPVCVTCQNLVENGRDSNSLMDQLKKTKRDGKEMCCAQTSDAMSALLQMTFHKLASRPAPSPQDSSLRFSPVTVHKSLWPNPEEKENPAPSPQDSSLRFSPVTVHKSLWPNPEEKENPVPVPIPQYGSSVRPLTFRNETAATEHVRNVEIGKDHLLVPYDGTYYVYASLLFKPRSDKPAKEFEYNDFYGYIKRISPGRPSHTGILIKLAHYVCEECSGDQETAFSGGAFQLFEGDKIQICSAALYMMDFTPESSYAGLVMLASG